MRALLQAARWRQLRTAGGAAASQALKLHGCSKGEGARPCLAAATSGVFVASVPEGTRSVSTTVIVSLLRIVHARLGTQGVAALLRMQQGLEVSSCRLGL